MRTMVILSDEESSRRNCIRLNHQPWFSDDLPLSWVYFGHRLRE